MSGGDGMPTIGIWVDEETKRKYEILNKHPERLGTKALKEALQKAFEEYKWWLEVYEDMDRILQSEAEKMKKEKEINGAMQNSE